MPNNMFSTLNISCAHLKTHEAAIPRLNQSQEGAGLSAANFTYFSLWNRMLNYSLEIREKL